MTRVVVETDFEGLEDVASSCPVNAFRQAKDGRMVIDPAECIDCGVCQSEVPEGVIVEESEASAKDIEFNADHAEKWKPVQ